MYKHLIINISKKKTCLYKHFQLSFKHSTANNFDLKQIFIGFFYTIILPPHMPSVVPERSEDGPTSVVTNGKMGGSLSVVSDLRTSQYCV